MFRRNDNEVSFDSPKATPANVSAPTPTTTPRIEPAGKGSSIGASLHVKGEITGAEDLVVDGIVEGGVKLNQNTVTIGRSGRVMASIHAKVIHVEGEVTGDLFAVEAVTVARTGSVRGNINSPRVTLEDGSRLKGSIDTEAASVEVKMNMPVDNSSKQVNGAKKSDAPAPVASTGAALQ